MKRAVHMLIITCLVIAFSPKKSNAQASWETYGQNRIQYRTFDWKYYDSTNFRAFYYRNGEHLALYILNEAERDLSEIVQLMGGRLPRKLNLVVYNSYSDFVQTNIGRQNDDHFNQADGGKVEVVGDNIPIYFTGSHEDLKKQVRKGIAKVIKDNMLFGDNIKEAVKNAIKMNLPEWYTLGYVQHISEDWTPLMQADVQSILAKDTSLSFSSVSHTKPELIGHSFWYFIQKKYGANYVSNLLYLTRFRKGVNDAIDVVFRKEHTVIYKEWRLFYTLPLADSNSDRHAGKKLATVLPDKFATTYSNFSLSPNGSQFAFVEKKEGTWAIYIQETDLKDTKLLLDGGFRDLKQFGADIDYPLMAWSQSGKNLAILYPVKNQLVLRVYNTNTQRKYNKIISPRKIERVTGMCFTNNDGVFIFSGIKKGQSDIYRYSIQGNRIDNITDDIYDDKEPSYVSSGVRNGVLFLSNRTATVLDDKLNQESHNFSGNFNVFFFDERVGKNLSQVTHSNNKLSMPVQYGIDQFAYIEEEAGKMNRKIVAYDKNEDLTTVFNQVETASFPYSILSEQYIHTKNSLVEVIKRNGNYYAYNTQIEQLQNYDNENPTPVGEMEETPQAVQPEQIFAEYETDYLDNDSNSLLNNIFTGRDRIGSQKAAGLGQQALLKRKYQRYKPTFYPDFIITSLDNSLLFTRYQVFSFNQSGFQFPSLNGFITTSLTDIMEDYKLTGGIRVPLEFNGLAYFLEFANYRKRKDWKLTYFHQSNMKNYDASEAPDTLTTPYPGFTGKVSTDYFQAALIHPFNVANSLHFNIGIRYDRVRYLARDQYTIKFPDQKQFWSFARVEYIYDNAVNPLLNIWKGSRAKVFAEYQYKFNSPSQGFYNFGFDARNYTTIYKNCILASRMAAGFSGGNAKLLYYLGGVDNPIYFDAAKNIEQNNPPDPTQNYAFQTTATNLRGYKLQARNGNSYMVVNEEIRLPLYNTFFKRSIKSGFLRNLQVVAFSDIGTAWRGLMPNEDNLSITRVVSGTNILATVVQNQNYLAWGYGAGLRSRLLGYFIRVDAAWNIDGDPKPLWHVSLATDF